jgi:hypothetical protein
VITSPGQTITVENTPPPPEVLEQAHVVMFRRNGTGRHGFFPLPFEAVG